MSSSDEIHGLREAIQLVPPGAPRERFLIEAAEKAEAERDSLRLELEAEKFQHRKDNEYIWAEVERLRAELRTALDLLEGFGVAIDSAERVLKGNSDE
jgi:hypothetical protein